MDQAKARMRQKAAGNVFQIEESEAEFQGRIIVLARSLGWDWLHIHTTGTGSNKPARGSLGDGWPDLVLLRSGRRVAAEVKRQRGAPPSKDQLRVLATLADAGFEVFVWRPSQWNEILETLAR